MKIIDLLKQNKPMLSFEVFPPKTSSTYDSVFKATQAIAQLKPPFISVTYGAAGGARFYSLDIARNLLAAGVMPLAHLTCVSSTKEQIIQKLGELKEAGIENIMALRGDIPEGFDASGPRDYKYASELIRDIKSYGDFCIGGACYPEGHVESANLQEDIIHLKEKADAGCDFFTTQMFFDNEILFSYLYKLREAGISTPVIAGVMPVTNANQIKRITALSGTYLPGRFKRIIDRFGDSPESMEKAGIAYATEQIISLFAGGITAVHVYSMNKAHVAAKIQENLKGII